jgi:ubiquitin carboxyl-terminal hydrolase L5
LFKWEAQEKARIPTVEELALQEHIYFAKQMIRNACATQAILNIGINLARQMPENCRLASDLQGFADFTNDFSPEMRGWALSNADFIKACHHRFSGLPSAKEDEQSATKEEESFHFVGILPIRDPMDSQRILIVEMDGLAAAPHIVASCNIGGISNGSDGIPEWVAKLCPILMDRMNAFSSHEIRFNLMAVTQDKLKFLRQKLEKIDSADLKAMTDIHEDIQEEIETREKNARLTVPAYASQLGKDACSLKAIIDSFCQKYQNLN